MSTNDSRKEWSEEVMDEEPMMMRKSTITFRSPIKESAENSIPPRAPKKLATKNATTTEDKDDGEEPPSSPTPLSSCIQVRTTPPKAATCPSQCIQVLATPPKVTMRLSSSIQVPATPESEMTIQETQGSPADP